MMVKEVKFTRIIYEISIFSFPLFSSNHQKRGFKNLENDGEEEVLKEIA